MAMDGSGRKGALKLRHGGVDLVLRRRSDEDDGLTVQGSLGATVSYRTRGKNSTVVLRVHCSCDEVGRDVPMPEVPPITTTLVPTSGLNLSDMLCVLNKMKKE